MIEQLSPNFLQVVGGDGSPLMRRRSQLVAAEGTLRFSTLGGVQDGNND